MKFREAIREDFDAITQLFTTPEEMFLIYPKGTFPLTHEQVDTIFKERIALTVLEDNQSVIGFANFYNYQPNLSAFIGNVVIDKAYRGQSLGKKMIHFMLDIASRKLHLKEVKISVFCDNTPALLLYSSFGFIPYAVEEMLDYEGKRVALLHMRYTIDEEKI